MKQSYFKKLAQNIGNFINLPWTVAKQHQMLQCLHMSGSQSVLDEDPEIGPGQTVAGREQPEALWEAAADCYRTNWVKANGQINKKPAVLIIGVEDDSPVFSELQNVYVSDKVYFEVKLSKVLFTLSWLCGKQDISVPSYPTFQFVAPHTIRETSYHF